jgi:hypothetical protein
MRTAVGCTACLYDVARYFVEEKGNCCGCPSATVASFYSQKIVECKKPVPPSSADLGDLPYLRDLCSARETRACCVTDTWERTRSLRTSFRNFSAVIVAPRSESKVVFAYATIKAYSSSIFQSLPRVRRAARAAGVSDGSLSALRTVVALACACLLCHLAALYLAMGAFVAANGAG